MMAITNDGRYSASTVSLILAPLFHIGSLLACVEALPCNPSGKTLKTLLREPYWADIQRRIS